MFSLRQLIVHVLYSAGTAIVSTKVVQLPPTVHLQTAHKKYNPWRYNQKATKRTQR